MIRNANLTSLDARLRSKFLSSGGMIPVISDRVLKTRKTDRAYEIFDFMAGIPETGIVGENAIFPQAEVKSGDSRTLTVDKRGVVINVTRELIDDNLFEPVVDDIGKALRMAMDQARERAAVNLFNNGFSSTAPFATPDGVSLFNTAHVLKQGGTQSNSATAAALDLDTYWNAINTMKTSKDDSTLFASIYEPKFAIVPQELQRRIFETIRSDKVPFVFENTMNIAKQLYAVEPLSTPLLTSTTAWFLVADPGAVLYFGLIHLIREALSIKAQFKIDDAEIGNSVERDVYSWKARERYTHGTVHWNGTFGNAGA